MTFFVKLFKILMENFMNKLILMTMFISFSWTQCDANNDGGLDVMDIIVQVQCILDDCWENDQPSQDIYGFWMLDSAYINIIDEYGTDIYNDSTYCGEYDEYNNEYEDALVIYFNENNQGGEINIDHTFCDQDVVDLSNPSYYGTWEYEYDGDDLVINFEWGPAEFTIISLNENDLILNISEYDQYYGFYQDATYWFGKVSTSNLIRRSKLNISNNNPNLTLDYKKHLKSLNIINK